METDITSDGLAAEQCARVLIDRQLTEAGWAVQDKKQLNLFAAQGVACREVVMKPGRGRADYLLYVEQTALGVIEAKPIGAPLSGVEWQSALYAEGLSAEGAVASMKVDGRLPTPPGPNSCRDLAGSVTTDRFRSNPRPAQNGAPRKGYRYWSSVSLLVRIDWTAWTDCSDNTRTPSAVRAHHVVG